MDIVDAVPIIIVGSALMVIAGHLIIESVRK